MLVRIVNAFLRWVQTLPLRSKDIDLPFLGNVLHELQVEGLSIATKGDPAGSILATCCITALSKALAFETRVPDELFHLESSSGQKYRLWINALVSAVPNPRYLEIGSGDGSTACAAIVENQVKVFCVDDWSKDAGSKDRFLSNIGRYKTSKVEFSYEENQVHAVDYAATGRSNILFINPTKAPVSENLKSSFGVLDTEFVLIVGHWNSPLVREETKVNLTQADIRCRYEIDIRTPSADMHERGNGKPSDWYDGYHIGVYQKTFSEPGNVRRTFN